MVANYADNRNPDSLASRLRRRRMQHFFSLLERFAEPVGILDVGGTAGFWKANAPGLPKRCEFTLLNLSPVSTEDLPNAVSLVGDARDMRQFKDRSVQVCFSNSVIEHVGTLFDQMAMAQEIQRVSQAYFVQTPSRYFPMEPHFLVPCWQFLPWFVRTWLHQRFDLGWMKKEPSSLRARADVEQIRLLNRAEMARLFPRAKILRERLGPFTKSLLAVNVP